MKKYSALTHERVPPVALARFGGRRLTKKAQKIVVRATRTQREVNWPDWWEIRR